MSIWRTKPVDQVPDKEESKGLRRSLGAFELTALGVGAIIGTGIFVLTGVAAARFAGPGIIFSFIIAGVGSALAALVYAELASAVPVAGSAYTYTYVAVGELIAWLIGWNLVLEYTVAAGAVSVGWSAYFGNMLQSIGLVLPHWAVASPLAGGLVNLPAIGIALIVTGLLVLGTKESVLINSIVVFVKLAVIALFIAIGVFHVSPANWKPLLPFGPGGVVRGAAIIFFAYIGFDAVSTASEEVRNPQRNLPIGIIASLLISTTLYIVVAIILTGIVRYTGLNTAAPVATALLAAGVAWASGIVSVGALAGLTSVLLVMLYGQSRIFFAMSRDGLLPDVFAKVHPRFKTPFLITTITGLVVAALSGFLPVTVLAEMANIGTLSAFLVVAIGVIVLRRTNPELPRPFRTPFVPYLPVISFLFSLYLMINLPLLTWIRFVIWVTIGFVLYFAYGYRHSRLAVAPGPPGEAARLRPIPALKPLKASQEKNDSQTGEQPDNETGEPAE